MVSVSAGPGMTGRTRTVVCKGCRESSDPLRIFRAQPTGWAVQKPLKKPLIPVTLGLRGFSSEKPTSRTWDQSRISDPSESIFEIKLKQT